MSYQILFTTQRSERHQAMARSFAPSDCSLIFVDSHDQEKITSALSNTDYWISEREGVIDEALLRSAHQLKLIVRLGRRTHDIDQTTTQALGIAVTYQPSASVAMVAEHVFLQLLALIKQFNMIQSQLHQPNDQTPSTRTDANQFRYSWAGITTSDTLVGKQVGLLGFGEIGIEIARRLQNWDCTMTYHKRSPLPAKTERQYQIHYRTSEQLLQESDILINLLPYSSETDHYLNRARIASLKSGAYMVSVGSGSTIDEVALADALRARKISGIALDTYEYEPIPQNHPLLACAEEGFNVVLTPHIAGGVGAYQADMRDIYMNILRHRAGDALINQLV